MFTSIKIKNYKSLVDLEVNLAQKRNEPKPVILVYGENGVGKSNFANVFYTLSQTLQTLSVRKTIQEIIEKKDRMSEETIIKLISQNLGDIESIIRNCKTKCSDENMLLEFGFTIDENPGNYILEFDSNKIVHEKLDFVLNKNKTNFYDITTDKIKINDKIFLDNDYAKEFKELLIKYQGKHTFLSIVLFDIEEKAEGYVKNKISDKLYDVLGSFLTMSIRVKAGNKGERWNIGISHEILGKLDKGEIDLSNEEELNKAEEMVNEFFTLVYSDIKEAYYKKEIKEGKIEYELMFRKLIYEKIVDIEIEYESTGTLHLLDILPYLLMGIEGRTVVIDELDSGIHDLLVSNILCNILDSIKGQLIITTHNTMLLETDIDPAYIYTFMVDSDANKTLTSIMSYEDRAHPNLNYRNRYLKGMYGGIPISRDIDFSELLEILD